MHVNTSWGEVLTLAHACSRLLTLTDLLFEPTEFLFGPTEALFGPMLTLAHARSGLLTLAATCKTAFLDFFRAPEAFELKGWPRKRASSEQGKCFQGTEPKKMQRSAKDPLHEWKWCGQLWGRGKLVSERRGSWLQRPNDPKNPWQSAEGKELMIIFLSTLAQCYLRKGI